KQGRLCIAWNGPGFASSEFPALEVACEVLAGTNNSRLSRRMVQAERIATGTATELRPRELGVLIILTITPGIGVPISAIEAVAREEIERLPGTLEPKELDVARLRLFAKAIRGLERVGGPNSRSDVLGLATIVSGGVRSHRSRLSIMADMQPDAVSSAALWLRGAGAILEMHPTAESNGR
ncbi:MAG: hypothetical protein JO166_16570, partial [Deltaproteobacteria bacterium]|nr:hypothetical protein [Deltaproteobacteria bacterium]